MDSDEARQIAERLTSPLGKRWLHVQRVAATAEVLAEVEPAAREQLVVAAWLHDVGYGRELVVAGFHPLDGARYLADLGVDPLVVSLVAHHTGARVEAEERGLADDLAEFPEPPASPPTWLAGRTAIQAPEGAVGDLRPPLARGTDVRCLDPRGRGASPAASRVPRAGRAGAARHPPVDGSGMDTRAS